jgi:hypothetical protein
MSHFTVLVVGDDIEKQLQPFHEFECTGVDDEHVRDVDETDEVREYMARGNSLADALEYFGLKAVREERLKEDLDLVGPHKYGYAVVRASTRWSASSIEHALSGYLFEQGAAESQVRAAAEAAAEVLSDDELVRVVRRTNPDKKWDWYQVGGRWSGMLLLKPGAVGECGEPGVMGSRHKNEGVDSALKRDVDFESMQQRAAESAGDRWLRAHEIIAGRTWLTWEQLRSDVPDIDTARMLYRAQPVVLDFAKCKDFAWGGPDEFAIPCGEYVVRARRRAISTFALLKDGKWYERGSMGWWGIVHDEKDEDEWLRQFEELLQGLPPDTRLTIVDCHI